MAVYIEESYATMFSSTNAIGKLAQRRQVVSSEQGQTIRKRKSLPILNLLGYRS
jgi:hypothetical protein